MAKNEKANWEITKEIKILRSDANASDANAMKILLAITNMNSEIVNMFCNPAMMIKKAEKETDNQ